VTGSDKISLITHVSRYNFSEWYTTKFHIQNKLHLSGLLLLAAFLKHSRHLYKQSGVQMVAWPVLGWLWVAVQLCGVE